MNLEPSEEQKAIVAQVRRFVREEIVRLEDKLDPAIIVEAEQFRPSPTQKSKSVADLKVEDPASGIFHAVKIDDTVGFESRFGQLQHWLFLSQQGKQVVFLCVKEGCSEHS